jgi:peptide-methionine (S)-S-oxide reductase
MPIARTLRRSGLLFAALAFLVMPACADETPKAIPAPVLDSQPQAGGGLETAVLSGGCFWGMQGVFEHVKGVVQVLAGYSGGARDKAHYETVSTGDTGHAESVKIVFDPKQVSYGQILRVYFSVAHDPTELNYQGPDSGTQYRSNIWFADDMQKRIAQAYIGQLGAAHVFGAPIVTRVDPLVAFYPAEGYHQDYLIHNPDQPYIVYNDLPKIDNLKRLYGGLYRATPVTVDASHMPS